MNQNPLFATCLCGKVKFEAVGRPILTVSCYCTSCQDAGHRFAQLLRHRPCSIPTVAQA